ncbi:MAG: sulfite exporter TauE/SafE family protein, partial [Methyloversatilis sp.]|nr:sulfite exporter TauE/SafE family protein [Methyloversatilis sp.]
MKIRHIDTRPTAVGQAHEALGLPPVEQVIDRAQTRPLVTIATWLIGFTLFGLATVLLVRGLPMSDPAAALAIVIEVVTSKEFLTAAAVGFIAQSIDGALGMAYGISATTFLLGTGASPAVASASVHIAEIFTTGLSGLSHLRLGNVDRKLMLRLLVPGVIGGVLGA